MQTEPRMLSVLVLVTLENNEWESVCPWRESLRKKWYLLLSRPATQPLQLCNFIHIGISLVHSDATLCSGSRCLLKRQKTVANGNCVMMYCLFDPPEPCAEVFMSI